MLTTNKLTISDLITTLNKDQDKNQIEREQKLHLSQLDICGYKYRYELDNDIKYPFNWKYLRGNAIEFAIWLQVKNADNTYEHNPKIEIGDNITGSPDFISIDKSHIIELKSSKNEKYKEIYERQLKAYMFVYTMQTGKQYSGSLWMYNTIKDSLYSIGEYDKLTENDILTFKNSVESFTDNEYKEGIENSLCTFCDNIECPVNKKVKKEESISYMGLPKPQAGEK